MTASKSDTHRSSADGFGETDFAKVDAHVITPEEYEEIPELTDEMLALAIPGNGEDIARRGRGRPRLEAPKQQVTLRLDADVLEHFRDSGPGWQGRMNDILRGAMSR